MLIHLRWHWVLGLFVALGLGIVLAGLFGPRLVEPKTDFQLRTMLVEEFRSDMNIHAGNVVTVIGFLYPVTYDDDVEDVVLAPLVLRGLDLPYLEYVSRVSVLLGTEIYADDGSVDVDERCFGEPVRVTGKANLFSGVPAIQDIRLIIFADHDSEVKCNP